MKFNTEDLHKLVYSDTVGKLERIQDTITGNGRWSIHHHLVFHNQEDNNYYETQYSVGATEYQDEQPFEYEDDYVECDQVFPEKVTITVYNNKKNS